MREGRRQEEAGRPRMCEEERSLSGKRAVRLCENEVKYGSNRCLRARLGALRSVAIRHTREERSKDCGALVLASKKHSERVL
eukprot:1887854-Rhodomonas_salina.2